MLRALLATLFTFLIASAAITAEHTFEALSDARPDARPFADPYVPFAPPQGQDTEDIDKQPCVSARHGGGKTAVDAPLDTAGRRHMRIADGDFPQQWTFSKHILFLHACAPRAPPQRMRA
jgi:hypothetical protein